MKINFLVQIYVWHLNNVVNIFEKYLKSVKERMTSKKKELTVRETGKTPQSLSSHPDLNRAFWEHNHNEQKL